VTVVCDREPLFRVEAGDTVVMAEGLINATGTWEKPFVPHYDGAESFTGRQLHTKDYRTADEFAGKHVVVVGGGISAVQLLDEISQVTTTTWVTRRPPVFRDSQFDHDAGRKAVAMVEDRVRAGLPPGSVVSVTGLLLTPSLAAARERGHGGGIVMDGRLTTRVAANHRVHLLGYGPSASTIGANRAGRAAVTELLETLD
jgi:cation diffusion facilitator CzcD-associated flavoprotein CzcO